MGLPLFAQTFLELDQHKSWSEQIGETASVIMLKFGYTHDYMRSMPFSTFYCLADLLHKIQEEERRDAEKAKMRGKR